MTITNSAYVRNSTNRQFITKDDLTEKVRYIESYLDGIYDDELKSQFTDKTACYQKCLLFITVMFHQDKVALQKPERSFGRKAEPLSEFKRFHFQILQSMFGKNIGRKKQYQPKLFGWIDFAATRNGYGSAEKQNPHIHAVALVRPEYGEKYQAELTTQMRWFMSGTIQDIKVEQYDLERGSAANLIGYCVKGLEGLLSNEASWYELKLPPEDMRSSYGPSKLARMAGREYKLGPAASEC